MMWSAIAEVAWLGFVAVLFGASAATKLRYWAQFEHAVRTWRIVPRSLQGAAGVSITIFEVALGALALSAFWFSQLRSAALLTITVVFASFLVVQVLIMARTRSAECGCGGSGGRVNTRLLGRTGALLGLSSLVWLASSGTGA